MAGGHPIPTVEMTGKAGRLIVNADDTERFEKKGYRVVSGKAAEKRAEVPSLEAELKRLTVAELEEYVEKNGIDMDLDDFSKKSEKIAAIVAVMES